MDEDQEDDDGDEDELEEEADEADEDKEAGVADEKEVSGAEYEDDTAEYVGEDDAAAEYLSGGGESDTVDPDYIAQDEEEGAGEQEDPDYIPLSADEEAEQKAERRRKRREKKMRAKAAKEEEEERKRKSSPVRYLCVKAPGAVVRAGADMSSEKTGEFVYVDEVVVAYEEAVNEDGVHRIRCDRGWISATASDGTVVLVPTESAATGAVSLDSPGTASAAPADEERRDSRTVGRPPPRQGRKKSERRRVK